MSSHYDQVRILGIDFYNDTMEKALDILSESGGLLLAPSGPGLSVLGENSAYDAALHGADINLIDSGYLALLWKKRTGQNVIRNSGLRCIQDLLESEAFRSEPKQLWVTPSREHSDATSSFLGENNINLAEECYYEAPYYDGPAVTDQELLQSIEEQRPKYIIICIAGGKQEVLGHWLRNQLNYKPAILCIGAAIAFLTGQQANIPTWADRIYIGWLLRILHDPKTFLPRYWNARKLRKLLAQYGSEGPTGS